MCGVLLCMPGRVSDVRAVFKAGSHKDSPGALQTSWKEEAGGLAWSSHPLTFTAPSSFHLPFPPLYHGVGVNIPVGTSPGYKGLEPIMNRKTQTETVPFKNANSKGCFFQTTQCGWEGHFCGSRHPKRPVTQPQASGCFGVVWTPRALSPLVPAWPGPSPQNQLALFLCVPHPALAPGLSPQPIRACSAGDLPRAGNKLSSYLPRVSLFLAN